MNTQQRYQRRVDRSARENGVSPVLVGPSEDAISGDLTKPGSLGQSPSMNRPRRTIAWVRVSELHAVLGSRAVGRGIDLQNELASRARAARTQQNHVASLHDDAPAAIGRTSRSGTRE
ncbi:hypothetical protein IDH50_11145 [Aeromicrobium tamlense]|uniref:Uncharacterized protein n=1 Tax=Aeromicrobium tamlense TaxID=375541 RepID=A0A8I0KNI1_9ACTN|nr:hypothetical protein [Aeromicrobium tamlense]MBD1270789.1 hypothetical protein [Aeromicrobium tamlense]NYI38181.1 hypothetical protein [Aeromicrobium tamlense]